jgi:two-component sensor histidine kinase
VIASHNPQVIVTLCQDKRQPPVRAACGSGLERKRVGDQRFWVKLRRTSTELTLVVEDDGIGYPEEAKNGLGSRLTRLLVQQLGGTMTRESATPGCRIMITVPSAAA